MVEFSESVGDVVRHVDVYDVLGVVPMESEAAIVAASPIGSNGVGGGEDSKEMDDIFDACVLDAEVVDTEDEGDWAGDMGP